MTGEKKTKTSILLPGAEKFSKYLEETVTGELSVDGPTVVDWSYDCDYVKEWIVKLNGIEIGRYCTQGPKPGEIEFGRDYSGRLPGYVNELAVITNRRRAEEDKTPIDRIGLTFSNSRYVASRLNEGPGRLEKTSWQRQDGHKQIPFP